MKKTALERQEIKLVGISIRTNNKQESDPSKAKISPCIQRFFQEGIPGKIANRKAPNTMYCAYTDYESDHTGDYTFFVGEEVSDFDKALPAGMQKLVIPKQKYTKFTTPSGPMPGIVINAWQTIWNMSSKELGGERNYKTDFQLHDVRAVDPHNAVIDLYIGIS